MLKKIILKTIYFPTNKILKVSSNLLKNFNYKYIKNYSKNSFAMEGEDIIVDFLFGSKCNGFFVDVGAHHPKWLSNTYFFYKKGWRGINIDPLPCAIKKFNKLRNKDINLELGVSEREESLIYYEYNKPEYNTFSEKVVEQREKDPNFHYLKLKSKRRINLYPLKFILDKYLPKDKQIDLLSIDTEGFDLNVLRSNDWDKYRPNVIVIECSGNIKFAEIQSDPIFNFLDTKGYNLFAKTRFNFIFKSIDN